MIFHYFSNHKPIISTIPDDFAETGGAELRADRGSGCCHRGRPQWTSGVRDARCATFEAQRWKCGVDMAKPLFSGFAMENHTSLIGTSSCVKNKWPNAIAALAMLPLYQTSIAMV